MAVERDPPLYDEKIIVHFLFFVDMVLLLLHTGAGREADRVRIQFPGARIRGRTSFLSAKSSISPSKVHFLSRFRVQRVIPRR